MSRSARRKVSICVPVLNEEDNVRPLFEAVSAVLDGVADRYDYEFVFTDNCSDDATWSELQKLSREHPNRVRAYRFSRNFGFQKSIMTGYRKATGDAVMQIDCDLQDPPEMLLKFIEAWEDGHDIVYGVRRSRQEGRLITAMRSVFYRLIDALSEDHLPKDAGDFRLVDRAPLEAILNIDDQRPYLRGTLATIGYRQKGIPYDRAARERGESKFPFKALLGLALDGILSHSTVPLRMATYLGLCMSIVTFLCIIGYGVARVLFGQHWPAGFATTTVLQLLAMSLNALFLGVIGEYVGRIYHQVRREPFTLIAQSIEPSIEPAEPSVSSNETGSSETCAKPVKPTPPPASETA